MKSLSNQIPVKNFETDLMLQGSHDPRSQACNRSFTAHGATRTGYKKLLFDGLFHSILAFRSIIAKCFYMRSFLQIVSNERMSLGKRIPVLT
jgi:hypothetical protein